MKGGGGGYLYPASPHVAKLAWLQTKSVYKQLCFITSSDMKKRMSDWIEGFEKSIKVIAHDDFFYFICFILIIAPHQSSNSCLIRSSSLSPLTVSLRSIITVVHNQILRSVVVLSAKIALQDRLGAISVSLLGVERGTGHVWDHGVSAAEGVLGVAEWVLLRRRLREPDVPSVAAEVA